MRISATVLTARCEAVSSIETQCTLDLGKNNQMLKILGVPASNSGQSINAMLVRHAVRVMQLHLTVEAEFSVLDLNDFEMPIYKPEREKADGIPLEAREFVRHIGFSDALIMSFAEHNGNVSAAFKNIFDWASRIEPKVYHGRPMLMMATTPGARGGASVLEIASTAAPFFEGEVFGTFSLPNFNETFDRERNVILDADKSDELSNLLRRFSLTLTGDEAEEV